MAQVFLQQAFAGLTAQLGSIATSTLGSIYSHTLGAAGSAVFGSNWALVERGAMWVFDKVAAVNDWLGQGDTLMDIYDTHANYRQYEQIRMQRDRIKELEKTTLDLPALDDWEASRNEMMDILATEPDALAGTFNEATLRKYGIDPASIDAETAIAKRGARARFSEQQDAMSRQFARTGVQGSAAMAAAQAQMGLGASAADAQMGLEAERGFTEQLEGVQDRMERTTAGILSMEQQKAIWEVNKQKALADMESAYMDNVVGLANRLASWEPDPVDDPIQGPQGEPSEEWDPLDPKNLPWDQAKGISTVNEDGSITFTPPGSDIEMSRHPDYPTFDEVMSRTGNIDITTDLASHYPGGSKYPTDMTQQQTATVYEGGQAMNVAARDMGFGIFGPNQQLYPGWDPLQYPNYNHNVIDYGDPYVTWGDPMWSVASRTDPGAPTGRRSYN